MLLEGMLEWCDSCYQDMVPLWFLEMGKKCCC